MSLPIASRARNYWQNLTRVLNSGNTGKHGPEPFGMLSGRLGLHPRAARDFLDTLVALGFLEREGDQYDVIVQTNPSGRDTPDDIEKIFVRGRGDAMIPLSALVKIREVVVPRELNHFGQRRSAALPSGRARSTD